MCFLIAAAALAVALLGGAALDQPPRHGLRGWSPRAGTRRRGQCTVFSSVASVPAIVCWIATGTKGLLSRSAMIFSPVRYFS